MGEKPENGVLVFLYESFDGGDKGEQDVRGTFLPPCLEPQRRSFMGQVWRELPLVYVDADAGDGGAVHELRLVDLPGYGFASGPREERDRWKGMIETYLTGRESLRLLVVVVDGEIGAQPSDAEMVRWGASLDKTLAVVATKLDRVARTRRDGQVRTIAAQLDLPRERVIGFSAREMLGVDELWQRITVGTPP